MSDNETAVERMKDRPFEVTVSLTMKVSLALTLAEFILDNNCENKALRAIAHQILSEE